MSGIISVASSFISSIIPDYYALLVMRFILAVSNTVFSTVSYILGEMCLIYFHHYINFVEDKHMAVRNIHVIIEAFIIPWSDGDYYY